MVSGNSKYSALLNLGVRDIVVLDTEYISRKGEAVIPVCLCAQSLLTGREWREFYRKDSFSSLPIDTQTLYVTFAAPAEWSYFLAAGWNLPTSIIDLYAERMLETNGRKNEKGKREAPSLLSSLEAYGIDSMSAAEKESMRNLILRGAPYTVDEQNLILDYCMEDVHNTAKLFDAMLPDLDIQRAIFRGGYTRVVGHVEFNGIPVDTKAIEQLKQNWPDTMAKLAAQLEADHGYGCYIVEVGKTKWNTKGFESLIHRMGLADQWPRTATGKFMTSDAEGKEGKDVFKRMAELHPELEDLRQMRKTFSEMKLFDLPIGEDGRCRTHPFPWWTVTGRNQPKRGFIFSLPKWARFLIKPAPGRALAYLDLVSAEFGIAAALSQDKRMMETYRDEEDNYLRLAKLAGAVPADATKLSHSRERKLYKVAMLGSQYDMSEWGLSKQVGVSRSEAKGILDSLKDVYRRYFTWIEYTVILAQSSHRLAAPMGWSTPVNEQTNPRSLFNFPMQAACAEILHIATEMMIDRGIQIDAMVHDAVLIEAAEEDIDRHCDIVRECWWAASEIVLGGFGLDSDCKITRYPESYFDEDGEKMWQRLQQMTAA